MVGSIFCPLYSAAQNFFAANLWSMGHAIFTNRRDVQFLMFLQGLEDKESGLSHFLGKFLQQASGAFRSSPCYCSMINLLDAANDCQLLMHQRCNDGDGWNEYGPTCWRHGDAN